MGTLKYCAQKISPWRKRSPIPTHCGERLFHWKLNLKLGVKNASHCTFSILSLLVIFLLQGFNGRSRHISTVLTLDDTLRFRNAHPHLSAPHTRLYLTTLRTLEKKKASLTAEFTSAKSLIDPMKADVKAEKEGGRTI
jgi:hypothetical protein